MRPIDILFGGMRERAQASNCCVPAPIGCGGIATTFTDNISKKEYDISGFCQNCQDRLFNSTQDHK